MKRFLFSFLVASLLGTSALVAADTIAIHPGETYYARFQQKGKKIKLLAATREKDGTAQLVISLSDKDSEGATVLKLESAFTEDLIYKALIHSRVFKRHAPLTVYPIVGGKLGTVKVPPFVDEVVLSDFRFDPANLIEKEKEH
jgi:hypothetical protein